MRFFLDHDVPSEVSRILARDGHDVIRLADRLPTTASDSEVFDAAQVNEAVLVTCNREDFLHLAKSRSHLGLIVVVRRRTRIAECAAVLRLLAHAGVSGIDQNINFA